jgi:hypothetical protein
MPEVIAVGGRFRLGLSAGGFGSSQIEPASTALVQSSAGEFEFTAPSTVAFLAFSGGRLSDFAHLTAVAPDSIRVMDSRGGELETLRLEVGEDVTLSAVPFRGADALAGGLRYTWSSANSRVLQAPLQPSATATVLGRAVGTTTLRLRTPLGLTTEITVTVVPAADTGAPVNPISDAGAADAGDAGDAALDAGAADGAAPTASDAGVVAADADLPGTQLDAALTDAASSAPAPTATPDAGTPNPDAGVNDAEVNDGGSL